MKKLLAGIAVVGMVALLTVSAMATAIDGSANLDLTIEEYLRLTVLDTEVSITVEFGQSGNNAPVPFNIEVAANVDYDVKGKIIGSSTVQVGCDYGTDTSGSCTPIYASDFAWGLSASAFNGEVWRSSESWPTGIYGQASSSVVILSDEPANEPGEVTHTLYTGVCTWTFSPSTGDGAKNHLGYFWGKDSPYDNAATIEITVVKHT